MIVGNVGNALFGSLDRGRVDQDEVALGQVVEQRDQTVLEQREPVLHAGEATAVGDSLIERIAGGVGAEQFAVAAAEALDAVVVKQGFARRQQEMRFDRLHRALRVRIEQAQGFKFVAEEVQTEAVVEPRRIDVEDRAAHGVFARVDDRIGARIALALEECDQALATDFGARRKQAGGFADAERREDTLERSVDRRDKQLRTAALALQPL